MSLRSRSANFELSIPEDELEQDRILLEHNLQHTDISLHLSSTAPEDSSSSDAEYPRHNMGPTTFAGLTSFDRPSRDHFDPADEHSYYHAWSYRSVDDDDGVAPDDGRTISTAAHHASALTLSAGLGGRASRRDVSLSGAEYDPDRPLHGIIAGYGTRAPGFDGDSTKSKHFTSTVDFDPLVVDDSAEVEEILLTHRIPVPALGLPSSSSTSSSSRPSTPLSPRPKLSDALHQVAFSPKRPRTRKAQPGVHRSPSQHHKIQSSVVRPLAQPGPRPPSSPSSDDESIPTSKSRKSNSSMSRIYQQSLSYAAPAEPEVNFHPPTPDNLENASKFTKMARGLAREIEERSRYDVQMQSVPSEERHADTKGALRDTKHVRTDSNKVPLRSVIKDLHDPRVTRPKSAQSRTPHAAKICLPDVTGLTSVVASPAKLGLEYTPYDPKEDVEIDVRLATILNIVQSKLAYLASENSISRRRVRELELELEECKRQVARERSKILNSEQTKGQKQHDPKHRPSLLPRQEPGTHSNSTKGTKVVVESAGGEVEEMKRYKEAVEEKKALEALISTLRTHLSRLTAELSDHHRLLEELRSLRDSDVRALKDKSHDVDQLRQEVERLSGEVEVLRGVVEEGLKERREAREQAEGGFERTHRPDSESTREDSSDSDEESGPAFELRMHSHLEEDSSDDRSTRSRGSSPEHLRVADHTERTDQATVGSSPVGVSRAQPFISSREVQRIAEEVSERRSERSTSANDDVASQTRSPDPPPSDAQRVAGDNEPDVRKRTVRPSPKHDTHRVNQKHTQTSSRPTSPLETFFPQIRGEHLEQLFFSAPEHNAETCTVCRRRRRSIDGHRTAPSYPKASWGRGYYDSQDDEGFAEGHEEAKGASRQRTKGKQREGSCADDRLPPQTVVARVLRELEDDFTHYKGIYIELADQYKMIDAVSNVAKRNVLAQHLREVIDVLEQKGDQIASLYDLLTFEDKPIQDFIAPQSQRAQAANAYPSVRSWSRIPARRAHHTAAQ